MHDINRPSRIYVMITISLGALVLLWEAVYLSFNHIGSIILFAILLLISEFKPVNLPNRGTVSVGFIICLAANLLFGPSSAVWVALLGSTSYEQIKRRRKWYQIAFNLAQIVLSVELAGRAFIILGGSPGNIKLPQDVIPILVAALVHFLINSTLVTIIISLSQEVPFLLVWTSNVKSFIPNLLALTPLAVLMAMTYQQASAYGLLLFFIPMLLARHSFQMYMDMRDTYSSTIRALAKAIDAKDTYTGGHSERVAQYAVSIAKRMGIKGDDLELFEYVAMLHDIGKIGVPEAVLNKPGRLEPAEREAINKHSAVGAEIIGQVKFLSRGAEAVRHHHEWYNGNGYPDHLRAEEASLWARIITVADAFDAMTSERPYRQSWSVIRAVAELEHCSGTQFDPAVVKVFKTILAPQLQAEQEAAAGVS